MAHRCQHRDGDIDTDPAECKHAVLRSPPDEVERLLDQRTFIWPLGERPAGQRADDDFARRTDGELERRGCGNGLDGDGLAAGLRIDLAVHFEQGFVGAELEVERNVGLGHQNASAGPKGERGRAR